MKTTFQVHPTPSRHVLSLLAALLACALPARAGDFLVTNLNDAGPGSLRQAIIDADTNPGADVIQFADGLTGQINLTSGELAIISRDGVTIEGPGAKTLAVDAGQLSRVLRIDEGANTIRGLTLRNGRVGGNGGGIWFGANSSSPLTLEDCAITGNNAGSHGGGLYLGFFGRFMVRRCLFSDNVAGAAGGAAFFDGINDVTLENCTLVRNQANGGGAIYIGYSGRMSMESCTVTANTAQTIGGLYINSSARGATLHNCIVVGNSSTTWGEETSDVHYDYTSLGYNLIGKALPTGWLATDQLNVQDAFLGDLADNGGPTMTCALLPGGPALDAADPVTFPATDQRGFARPQGARADIGAFEDGNDIQAPVVDDLNDVVVSQTGSAANTQVVTYSATGSDNVTAPENLQFTFSPPSGSAFPLGSTLVTVTAEDEAGNVSEPKTFYVRVLYSAIALQQPINANGSSVFKAGSTIPVKFTLTGPSAGIADLFGTLRYQRISSSTGPVNESVTAGDTAGNSSTQFRYDATTGQYVFNWSTKGLATGTYKLLILLDDGTTREQLLSLGK